MYHVLKVEQTCMPVTRFRNGKKVGTINLEHAIIIDKPKGWFYFIVAGTSEDRFYTVRNVELSTMKQISDYVSDNEAHSFMERTQAVCEIISIYKESIGEYPKETEILLKEMLEDFFTRYGFSGYATHIWNEQLEKLLRKMNRKLNEFISQEKIDAFLKKLIDMNALVQYRKMTKGKNRILRGTDEVRHYRNVTQEKLKNLIFGVKKMLSNLDKNKFTNDFDSEGRPIRKYSFSLKSKKFGKLKIECHGLSMAIITLEDRSKEVTGLSFEKKLDTILTLKY